MDTALASGLGHMGGGGPPSSGSAPAPSPSPFPANKRLLWFVCGLLAGAVIVALIVYIVYTCVTVRSHSAHPEQVVPAITLQQQAHAALEGPPPRVPQNKLPSGVKRHPLSQYPPIDTYDHLPQASAPGTPNLVPLAAELTGMPEENAEPPGTLVFDGSAQPRVAYLRPGAHRARWVKGLPNQRLATIVFFHGPGGGLRFPYFPYDVPAAARKAVAWMNVSSTGHVDPRTRFQVLPGTHATVIHFRDRPQRPPK